MIIKVDRPIFEYLIDDPTQVRYGSENIQEWISEYRDPTYKVIMVQDYGFRELPEPKENQILYKYIDNKTDRLPITPNYKNAVVKLNSFDKNT